MRDSGNLPVVFTEEPPPLRILYHHRIAATDGMRVHINELVGALRSQGHVVHVVGPGSSDQEHSSTAGGGASKVEQLADRLRVLLPPALFELAELVYNIPAYRRLSREAKAFGPDIIYERYNLFLLAGLLFKRRHRLPMLMEINSPLATERAQFGNLQLKGVARRCEGALWRGADAALPVTQVLAEHVIEVRGERGVHVVPNGANLEKQPAPEKVAAVRQRFGLEPGVLVLGFVGFIRAWHGVGWAVEALPDLPNNVHLLVVGDGPARSQLEERAGVLGVAGRVHFSGLTPHDEVPAHMQCFDIALQTASVAYASPLKLFEYMGLGRATIAPDQPNIREVLSDDENALLFEPDNRQSFCHALARLCEDEGLRVRLGRNALKTVIETPYTWAHNAVRIGRLGRDLTGISDDEDAAAASTAVGRA